MKEEYEEMRRAERDLEMAGEKSELLEAYDSLPEAPKTIAGSMAAGAVIGNIIPIPGVGAGIGALVGGAVGLWRLKNK